MNKDQVKGRMTEAAGKVKSTTGKAVGNKKLEETGRAEELGGKVRATYGDVKNQFKKAVK
ncbi:MAG: CsbD family protein [Gammaproteobacteria bacterium]